MDAEMDDELADFLGESKRELTDEEFWGVKDKGYWARRANGFMKPRKIENPEKLWSLACGYFQSIDDAPYQKQELLKGGAKAGSIKKIPTMRPYTWSGLEAYVHEHSGLVKLDDYRYNSSGNYDEYSPVFDAIGKIMYSQKFDGATVGAFNANIIAMELGLAKKVIQANMNTESDIDYGKLSDSALEEIASQMKEKKAEPEED